MKDVLAWAILAVAACGVFYLLGRGLDWDVLGIVTVLGITGLCVLAALVVTWAIMTVTT